MVGILFGKLFGDYKIGIRSSHGAVETGVFVVSGVLVVSGAWLTSGAIVETGVESGTVILAVVVSGAWVSSAPTVV